MISSITPNLDENDFDLFRHLHLGSIGQLYPYSTKPTIESFIQQHKLGFDPKGYFTTKRTIWKACGDAGQTLAFAVITEKRGGSIKSGPMIVVPDHRNQGIASQFISLLEEEYSKIGYRKAYLTSNIKSEATIYSVTSVGYKIEIHLRDHYEIGKDELVFGKFLQPKGKLSWGNIKSDELSTVERIMYDDLVVYCDGIDYTFFKNIKDSLVDGLDKNEQLFVNKARKLFNIEEGTALALTVPKRGGCVKATPLILSGSKNIDLKLISAIKSFYYGHFHKIYTFSPLHTPRIKWLKDIGFFTEGLILEPYKQGEDLLVLSLFI